MRKHTSIALAAALAATVARCQREGRAGLNVTLPHKRAACRLADSLTHAAATTQAVNTLIFGPDGVRGDNTDVEGFATALGPPPGPRALVIGAGGAARAVLVALRRAGVRSLRVAARAPANAEEMVSDLGFGGVAVGALEDTVGLLPTVDLVVLALPPGRWAAEATLPWSTLPEHARVIHLAYGPAARLVVDAARAAGRRAEDGLVMLAAQGIAAFEAWTGLRPPLAAALSALGATPTSGPGVCPDPSAD